MHGGRKMLQNCSKLPPSPSPTLPVATEMSTDSSDELNQWPTATSTTGGTATAEPPRISAESGPCAPVVVNNGQSKHDLHNKAATTRKHTATAESLWSSKQVRPWASATRNPLSNQIALNTECYRKGSPRKLRITVLFRPCAAA